MADLLPYWQFYFGMYLVGAAHGVAFYIVWKWVSTIKKAVSMAV